MAESVMESISSFRDGSVFREGSGLFNLQIPHDPISLVL